MFEGLFCKSLNATFGSVGTKKTASPIPSLWVSLTYISRISNEIVFLNLHILYGINLNLIKFVTFLEKNRVFSATYSVCSISFNSIPFHKIPVAINRANVMQTSKCTILRVLKAHALDEVYIEMMICICTIESRCQIK